VEGLESKAQENYKERHKDIPFGMMMSLSQTKPPHNEQPGKVAASTGESTIEETRPVLMRGNRFDSRDIFQSVREIIIAHGEDTYRLRLTAQNKLILTK
jgi:hemin uptake protein HemP